MKFTLTIELGNDAMRSRDDVAGALQKIVSKLRDSEIKVTRENDGKIMDYNGNTVGKWEVTA